MRRSCRSARKNSSFSPARRSARRRSSRALASAPACATWTLSIARPRRPSCRRAIAAGGSGRARIIPSAALGSAARSSARCRPMPTRKAIRGPTRKAHEGPSTSVSPAAMRPKPKLNPTTRRDDGVTARQAPETETAGSPLRARGNAPGCAAIPRRRDEARDRCGRPR